MSTHTRPPSPHDFRAFYHHYFPSVWRFLEKLRVRAVDKPDLAQRVFSLAFEKRDEIPTDGARAWLLTTCRNFTRNDRRLSSNTLEILDPRAVANCPDPRDVERFRSDIDLASHILEEKMNVELADVFIRHEIEHEPLRSIAAALGICRNTAWNRVQVAKREFRRLEKEEMRGRRRPRRGFFLLPLGFEGLSSRIARARSILRRALALAAPTLAVALFAAIVAHHGAPATSASYANAPVHASATAGDIEAPPRGRHTADATPLGTTAPPAITRPSPSRPRPPVATRKAVRHEETIEDPDADRLGLERARRTFALGQYGATLAQIAEVMRDHPDSQYARALRALRAEAMERLGSARETVLPHATVAPGP